MLALSHASFCVSAIVYIFGYDSVRFNSRAGWPYFTGLYTIVVYGSDIRLRSYRGLPGGKVGGEVGGSKGTRTPNLYLLVRG